MVPSDVQKTLRTPLSDSRTVAKGHSNLSMRRSLVKTVGVACLCGLAAVVLLPSHTAQPALRKAAALSARDERPVRRLIIDTDMDYDDVMGLLFAARSSHVELLLVTICNTGFGWPIWATDLARAVLRGVGAGSVPVANGTSVPFAAAAWFPDAWGMQTIDYLGRLFGVSLGSGVAAPDATTALTAILEAAEGKVDYVAMGSHTNLAEALLDPTAREVIQRKLRRVVISGGTFRLHGNVVSSTLKLLPEFADRGGRSSRGAEVNVFLDTEATEIVCREASILGIEVWFMPLDATMDLVITQRQIEGHADAPPRSPLGLLQGTLRGFQETMPSGVQPRYWDASALVLVVQAAVCEDQLPIQGLHVETRVGPGFRYGHLIWEPVNSSTVVHSLTAACMQANYSEFLAEFWAPFGVQPYS